MDFYQKKQAKVIPEGYPNYQQGDCYAYIAMKPETRLHIAHAVGKRLDMIANHVIWKVSTILEHPTFTQKLEIYTDGNVQYTTAMLNHYRKDTLIYGQLIKIVNGGKLLDKYMRKIFGNPSYLDIDTVNIESYNSVLRGCISRLVRRTKCFSKKRSTYEKHLDIFQAYNNLIKTRNERLTPCMKEGLTTRKWHWNDLFMYR